MKQRIKISQRNIGDLWRLPCVQGLAKTLGGKMMVAIGPQAVEQLAYEGDWIVQNDDDTWSVQKGGEMTEYELDKLCERQDCDCNCARCELFARYARSREC